MGRPAGLSSARLCAYPRGAFLSLGLPSAAPSTVNGPARPHAPRLRLQRLISRDPSFGWNVSPLRAGPCFTHSVCAVPTHTVSHIINTELRCQ